jgi:hypothetical protein
MEHEECPSSEQLRTILQKLDQIWHMVSDSNQPEGSILDRQRKQAAQIEELKAAMEKVRGGTLWDHFVKSGVAALSNALVAFVILLMARGLLVEIAKGIVK